MQPTTLVVAVLIAAVATTIPTASAEDTQVCQSFSPIAGTVCATVKGMTVEECTDLVHDDDETIWVGNPDCVFRGVLVTGSG